MLSNLRRKSAKRKARQEWQHVGLVAGYLSGRHFLGTRDLHYGYWPDELEPHVSNLARAQENYCDFLLQHIPINAKRILDVGSGAGSVADKLAARGHTVDCVSPCSFLNGQARRLLDKRARIFECGYEGFDSSGLYDAVLFSESFQYIDMTTALERAARQLRSGGSLVICDFFRKEVDDKSPIRGGYRLQEFWKTVARFPFRLVRDLDITTQTAPTFTVIDQAFHEVVGPIWSEAMTAFDKTHPIWSTCAKWWFRRRINKFENKYLARMRTAEMFEKYKTYRLMVFERALRDYMLTTDNAISGAA